MVVLQVEIDVDTHSGDIGGERQCVVVEHGVSPGVDHVEVFWHVAFGLELGQDAEPHSCSCLDAQVYGRWRGTGRDVYPELASTALRFLENPIVHGPIPHRRRAVRVRLR